MTNDNNDVEAVTGVVGEDDNNSCDDDDDEGGDRIVKMWKQR